MMIIKAEEQQFGRQAYDNHPWNDKESRQGHFLLVSAILKNHVKGTSCWCQPF